MKKCGLGISYNDVRLITNIWAKKVTLSHKNMLQKGSIKKKSVHVTFDNPNGKQQTLLGDNTTHHTNGTIFQLSNPAVETIDASCERQVDLEEQNEESTSNFSTFRIPTKRNRKLPPPFPEFSDECKRSDLLVLFWQRNIAWVLVSYSGGRFYRDLYSISKDLLRPVGSYTAFMKDTSAVKTTKCMSEYLPVVPFPPKNNVPRYNPSNG